MGVSDIPSQTTAGLLKQLLSPSLQVLSLPVLSQGSGPDEASGTHNLLAIILVHGFSFANSTLLTRHILEMSKRRTLSLAAGGVRCL